MCYTQTHRQKNRRDEVISEVFFLRVFVDIASKKEICNKKKEKKKRKLGRKEKEEEEYTQPAAMFCLSGVTKL